MIYRVIIFICLIFVFASCAKKQCKYRDLSTIGTVMLRENSDTSYLHNVLADSLYKNCIDSLPVMNMVNSYISKLEKDTPVAIIEIFNSKDNYDNSESLIQSGSFYKDRIVRIVMNPKTKTPTEFSFYGSGGKEIYSGKLWHYNK